MLDKMDHVKLAILDKVDQVKLPIFDKVEPFLHEEFVKSTEVRRTLSVSSALSFLQMSAR